jgi:two-component system, LytTR family, sensor kinase
VAARFVVLVYTVLGLFFAGQVWVDYANAGHRVSWAVAITLGMTEWYLWALLTAPIVWLARRFRLARGRWLTSLAVHVPACAVCAVTTRIVEARAASFLTGLMRVPYSFVQIQLAFLTYWAIVGGVYAVEQYHETRERRLRAAQLETELAHAQVQSLRMQLHPHFLFNTLNAISALMREDVEAADVMMARLGDLLRVTLASAETPEVAVRQELEFVQMYLDLQRARIGDRLTTRIVASSDARALAVPTLLLQPIVENAVRHGAGGHSGPATIEVRARRVRDVLVIDVEDDGPGPSAQMTFGHGLTNTRMRLAAAHGPGATLEIMRGPNGGAIVRLSLPAIEASGHAQWGGA